MKSPPEHLRAEALWARLHWLGVLAVTNSYTATAQRLKVSKAAVSQHIRDLERATGVELVRRTTRSVQLTEAGLELVRSTAGAFEMIEDGLANVRNRASTPRGLVRVTAPVALGRQHVAPLLNSFLKEHKEVRVELDLSDRLASLAREGFDLAIRHTTEPPETHVAWKLCAAPALLVASREYLRRHGTPLQPGDLRNHACLCYARPGAGAAWSFAPLATGERVTVAVSGPLAANNSETLRDAVLAGLGVAIIPAFSLGALVAARRLVPLLAGWQPVGPFGDAIFAIRPYSAHVPLAITALVGHLRSGFAEADWASPMGAVPPAPSVKLPVSRTRKTT